MKTLQDLQTKLWNINSCRLLCRVIKNIENDILEELDFKKTNKPLALLSISLKSADNLNNHNNNNHNSNKNNNNNQEILISTDINNIPYISSSSSTSSTSSSSCTTSSSTSFSLELDNINENINLKRHLNIRKNKIKVYLFYHHNQNLKVQLFVNNVKKINSNIEFLYLNLIEQLEGILKNDIPIFILYDKKTEATIDPIHFNKCECDLYCKCVFYKRFYETIYLMFLNEKNRRYFTFLIDNFTEIKNNKKNFEFKNKWLLHKVFNQRSEKKSYLIKPYCISDSKYELNENFKQFLSSFNYPFSYYNCFCH